MLLATRNVIRKMYIRKHTQHTKKNNSGQSSQAVRYLCYI